MARPNMRRGKAKAVAVAVAAERPALAPWMVWAGLAAGLLAAAPVWGQTIPEVVKPRTDAPTLPPGSGNDQGLTRPRSENPLPQAGTARPLRDSGVIAPPVSGLGSTAIIKPPATDGMPIIPPPGSPGGDRAVVPK